MRLGQSFRPSMVQRSRVSLLTILTLAPVCDQLKVQRGWSWEKDVKARTSKTSVIVGQPEEGEGKGEKRYKDQGPTVMEARGGSSHPTEPKQGRLAERGVKRRFMRRRLMMMERKMIWEVGAVRFRHPPSGGQAQRQAREEKRGGVPGGWGAGRAQRGQTEVYKGGLRVREREGSVRKSAYFTRMRTLIPISSIHIRCWAWPHGPITPALCKAQTRRSRRLSRLQPSSRFSERLNLKRMKRRMIEENTPHPLEHTHTHEF